MASFVPPFPRRPLWKFLCVVIVSSVSQPSILPSSLVAPRRRAADETTNKLPRGLSVRPTFTVRPCRHSWNHHPSPRREWASTTGRYKYRIRWTVAAGEEWKWMAIHKDSISLVVAIDLNFPQTRHIHRLGSGCPGMRCWNPLNSLWRNCGRGWKHCFWSARPKRESVHFIKLLQWENIQGNYSWGTGFLLLLTRLMVLSEEVIPGIGSCIFKELYLTTKTLSLKN